MPSLGSPFSPSKKRTWATNHITKEEWRRWVTEDKAGQRVKSIPKTEEAWARLEGPTAAGHGPKVRKFMQKVGQAVPPSPVVPTPAQGPPGFSTPPKPSPGQGLNLTSQLNAAADSTLVDVTNPVVAQINLGNIQAAQTANQQAQVVASGGTTTTTISTAGTPPTTSSPGSSNTASSSTDGAPASGGTGGPPTQTGLTAQGNEHTPTATDTPGGPSQDAINAALLHFLSRSAGPDPIQGHGPPGAPAPVGQQAIRAEGGRGPPPGNREEPRAIRDKESIVRTQIGAESGGTLGYVHDEARPTLRPQYGIAGGASVVPTSIEQIRSDIEFDLFNLVQPGHGEGSDNKLFLYQEAWKKFIRFVDPTYSPNNWLGPSNYQHPLPWQWQNVKDSSDVTKYLEKIMKHTKENRQLLEKMGESSIHAFGRDIPEVAESMSSSGLQRDKRSVFEPIIHNKDPWTPALSPPGKDLDRRGFKRLYSAWRDPDAREVQQHNGGPTLRKRRALEVILQ
jgi:hypothetical protein